MKIGTMNKLQDEDFASDIKTLRQKISSLQARIDKHDKLYYNEASPIISDAEYDSLRRELSKLEEKYKKFSGIDIAKHTIGARTDNRLQKIKHSVPMLSLDNAFNDGELLAFLKRVNDVLGCDAFCDKTLPAAFICEPKYDGLSFSATYIGGNLVSAATRGDGIFGENITENMKRVYGLPLSIRYPHSLEVRGEVYMSKAHFLELNTRQQANGGQLFANPRNAAAGSLRHLDPTITAQRNLRYTVWGGYTLEKITSQFDFLQFLKNLGFCVDDDIKLATTNSELSAYYSYMDSRRSILEYDIDGVVFKVNDINLQNKLGSLSRFPRWAIAYKFPGERAKSRILNIIVQVSRHGILTPVAELEPVNIGGVLISRATLHNEDDVRKRDVRISDVVIVRRAGGVIPKIESVDMSQRPIGTHQYSLPSKCPICGSEVVQYNKEIGKRCSGDIYCTAQTLEKLSHFVSKHGFNIIGLGEKQIEEFYKFGWVKEYSDFWKLKDKNRLLALEEKLEMQRGWGQKSVENILSAIEVAKYIDFENFLYALGIRYIGKEVSRLLAQYYKSWDAFYNVITNGAIEDRVHTLQNIAGIGEKIAYEVISFFNNKKNHLMLTNLLSYITIRDVYDSGATSNIEHPLAEKTIVFTGVMRHNTRDEVKDIAKSLGARPLESISKNTDYIVVGDNPGSKLTKALAYGVKVLTEVEWIALTKKK